MHADEFRQKAKVAIEKEQLTHALDLYNKALALEPTDQKIRKELNSLRGLLRAELELRKRGALKIFAPLRQLQKELEAAKGIINPDDPLLNFVEKQLNGIMVFRFGGAFLILVLISVLFFLFLGERFELFELHTPTVTPTSTYVSVPLSNVPTQTIAPATMTFTVTVSPTMTVTETPFPTPTITLGYGRLIENSFPLETPNGKFLRRTLSDGKLGEVYLFRKQYVVIVDSKFDASELWYKCTWEVDGEVGVGWILAKSIEPFAPPTPTP